MIWGRQTHKTQFGSLPPEFPQPHYYACCEYGFLGRVVDLALYEMKVLGLKPPPGGLSTNPRLTFVTFAPVSVHSPHMPIMNLCMHFCAHGVGPSRFSIRDRYLIPAPPPHSCKVRWMAISDRPNALHNLARIVRTALSTRHCDEDLTGQVPRLWKCIQAPATESQPRYRD